MIVVFGVLHIHVYPALTISTQYQGVTEFEAVNVNSNEDLLVKRYQSAKTEVNLCCMFVSVLAQAHVYTNSKLRSVN